MNHLKLQLSHGADNLTAVELVHEELCHTFVHKLLNAFVELLGLHRVGVLDVLEHFGREAWQAAIVEVFALGERVANLECAVVGDTHDVAGIGFVYNILFLRHESRRR